jgi:hypothetical protein
LEIIGLDYWFNTKETHMLTGLVSMVVQLAKDPLGGVTLAKT